MLPFGEFLKICNINSINIEKPLEECDSIKYGAYRTAAKLRIIQKALFMNEINLKVIFSVFERHALPKTENFVLLHQKEVEGILSDIYFAAQRERGLEINKESILQSATAFLFDVYGGKKKGCIRVLSFKIWLTVLCQCKPREKYQYLFDQICDEKGNLSKKNLGALLNEMVKLTEYICEGLTFGTKLILGTIESCFCSSNCSTEICQSNFISWLMQDPQLLVWLSTLYRMQISESVSHNAKCIICRNYPIIGLRYRCLRCLSYDMCQLCFFTGKLNKKHKLKHPVQEYCCLMNPQQSAKAFFLTLKNKLYKKNSELQYLPAIEVESVKTGVLIRDSKLLDAIEICSRTLINGSRVSVLKFSHSNCQTVINHLGKECEELVFLLENFIFNKNACELGQPEFSNDIIKHGNLLKLKLQQLKLLTKYLMACKNLNINSFSASTPIAEEILFENKRISLNCVENLSPIAKQLAETQENSGNMTWDNYDLYEHLVLTSGRVSLCLPGDEHNHFAQNSSFEQKPERNVIHYTRASSVNSPLRHTVRKFGDSLTPLSSRLARGSPLDSDSDDNFSWFVHAAGDEESKKRQQFNDEKKKETNDEELEQFQCDLHEILLKLNQLSSASAIEPVNYNGDVKAKGGGLLLSEEEIDSIFMDFINGVRELIL